MDTYIDPLFSKYYDKYPLVLVDVGASGGAQSEWKYALRYLKIVGFEPDNRGYAPLLNKNRPNYITYLNTALYEQKATMKFYLTKRQEASSILKPNETFFKKFHTENYLDIQKVIEIKTDTLENQLKENQIDDIDFMKIDTQGSELFILHGATSFLMETLFGLEIEVEFAQIYENQPVFSEIDSFIKRFGFQLFDLQPYYWKRTVGKNLGKPKGQIIFADSLYLRDVESWEQILERIPEGDKRRAKILKSISICILYGYFDYAMEIVGREGSHFEKDERDLIMKRLRKNVSIFSKIPYFRGRGKFATMLNSFWKVLAMHNNQYLAQKRLGNT